MNTNSNKYIIIYSAALVIIVASVLAITSMALKDRQTENMRVEKMTDILRAMGEAKDVGSATSKIEYVNQQWNQYVTTSYVVDFKGNKIDGIDGFMVLSALNKEYDKPVESRQLPVFEGQNASGQQLIVLPTWGKGLWGPLWGYVALERDGNTIHGAIFDHKGETPGLGAEIATPHFYDQLKSKEIYEGSKLVSISVLKNKGSSVNNKHAIDGISGGTITSHGIEVMLRESLINYNALLDRLRNAETERIAREVAEKTAAEALLSEEAENDNEAIGTN